MFSLSYALVHLEGAARFLLRREGWLESIDNTDRGFWLSFTAALWMLPIFVWVSVSTLPLFAELSAQRGQVFDAPDLSVHLATDFARYILNWGLFPVVMYYLCGMLEVAGRYRLFIILCNWTSLLLSICVEIPYFFLANAGLIGAMLWSLSSILIFGFRLYLLWYIARHALKVASSQAVAIVVIDVLLSLIFIPGIVAVA